MWWSGFWSGVLCVYLTSALALMFLAPLFRRRLTSPRFPVMDQSDLLEPNPMGYAGRSLRFHVPNSGFDSRDGGQL